jgi:hypothetical protein
MKLKSFVSMLDFSYKLRNNRRLKKSCHHKSVRNIRNLWIVISASFCLKSHTYYKVEALKRAPYVVKSTKGYVKNYYSALWRLGDQV